MKASYQICKKTVMDTSDPKIRFDRDGVSNHYWDFHNNVKNNYHKGEEGKNKLAEIIKRIKEDGKNREFDCILGLSGGLDSSYMLHTMVQDYGLRPLVFHVDGGWNTEEAVNNINKLLTKLKLDLLTEVINWREMQDFQLAMFKSGVPHLDIPQDMAFISVLYKYANKYRIKYILNGGNISTECVLMPQNILYWGTDLRHIKDIIARYGTIELKTFPFISILYYKVYMRLRYNFQVVKPLNYTDFNKNDAINVLKKEYDWTPFPQKHFESRFTKFLEGYWLPNRFGYDMRRNQFSSLILTNQMSRDEAIKQLKAPPIDDCEAKREFDYIASKLNITSGSLEELFHSPLKYYYNYKNSKWFFELGDYIYTRIFNTRRGGAY